MLSEGCLLIRGAQDRPALSLEGKLSNTYGMGVEGRFDRVEGLFPL